MASERMRIRRYLELLQPGQLNTAIQFPNSIESVDLDLGPVDFGEFKVAISQARQIGGGKCSEKRCVGPAAS